jgi:hypothetical protein
LTPQHHALALLAVCILHQDPSSPECAGKPQQSLAAMVRRLVHAAHGSHRLPGYVSSMAIHQYVYFVIVHLATKCNVPEKYPIIC